MSYEGVIAVCSVLVLLGYLIDFCLLKEDKDDILKNLSELEEQLKRTPVKDWQIKVARGALRFWSLNLRLFAAVFGWKRGWFVDYRKPRPLVRGERTFELAHRIIGAIGAPFLGSLRMSYIMMVIVMIWCVGALFNTFVLFVNPPHVDILVSSTILLMPIVLISLTYLIVFHSFLDPILILMGTNHRTRFHYWFEGLERFFPFLCFSYLATMLGISIGDMLFPEAPLGYYLIPPLGVGDKFPTKLLSPPFALGYLNFLFDMLTMLISIRLLKWMIRTGKGIILVALVDIALSAVLSISLLASLRAIEVWPNAGFVESFEFAGGWLTGDMQLYISYKKLIPLLLTTFIPVALYSSAIIFLGFILRPTARLAGAFCVILSEKEKSPFLELAALLSIFIFTFKALAEWPELTKFLGE